MRIAQIVIGSALLLAALGYWTWHLAHELPWTFWFMSPVLFLGGGGLVMLLWHPVSHWLEDFIFEWKGNSSDETDSSVHEHLAGSGADRTELD